MSERRVRKSPRLPGYDYAQDGAYFITICAHERRHLFGKVHDDAMCLSQGGEIATEEWYRTGEKRPYVMLDAFVVMPNHVHGIVIINHLPGDRHHKGFVGTQRAASSDKPTPPHVTPESLSAIVRAYKSACTRRIRRSLGDPEMIVWQSRYHDHIIRDEAGLNAIRLYIQTNPARWAEDSLYEA